MDLRLDLHSRDVGRTLAFYREHLGFEVDGPLLRSGVAELRVVADQSPAPREHYLVVAVPDVRVLVRRLREAGQEVLREWTEEGERRALVSDPDGNLLELVPVDA